MREIKFRVWDNVDYMSKPFGFTDLIRASIEFTVDDKVMQYTGLRAKDMVEIYEGDIIEIENPRAGNKNQRYLVEWKDGRGKTSLNYNCVGDIGFTFTPLVKGIGNSTVFEPFEATVIGNVYENPELIK